jgi:hypothetical protein
MKKIFSLSFIFLLMAFTSMAQKNTADTSKKWNGVWDPTDPNCPCYSIQKQAEKEYQQMLKKEQKDQQQTSELKNNPANNASDVKSIKHKVAKKRKSTREKKYKKGKAVCPDV